MAYIDSNGRFHWCTSEIKLQHRQKVKQQWTDEKTVKNFIALIKSEYEYRRRNGGIAAQIASKWKFFRYELWLRRVVAQENRTPLNVAAKKHLEELKEPLQSESLYLIQLAKWGLRQGFTPENPGEHAIESALRALEILDQQRVASYINSRTIQPILDDEALAGTPEDAARNLLAMLSMRLQADPRLDRLILD